MQNKQKTLICSSSIFFSSSPSHSFSLYLPPCFPSFSLPGTLQILQWLTPCSQALESPLPSPLVAPSSFLAAALASVAALLVSACAAARSSLWRALSFAAACFLACLAAASSALWASLWARSAFLVSASLSGGRGGGRVWGWLRGGKAGRSGSKKIFLFSFSSMLTPPFFPIVLVAPLSLYPPIVLDFPIQPRHETKEDLTRARGA